MDARIFILALAALRYGAQAQCINFASNPDLNNIKSPGTNGLHLQIPCDSVTRLDTCTPSCNPVTSCDTEKVNSGPIKSFFNRDAKCFPSSIDCKKETCTPGCNAVTSYVTESLNSRPFSSFFNRDAKCAPSVKDCEKVATPCNAVETVTSKSFNSFFNRDSCAPKKAECESVNAPGNIATENAFPRLSSFLNRKGNAVSTTECEKPICNTVTEKIPTNSIFNRKIDSLCSSCANNDNCNTCNSLTETCNCNSCNSIGNRLLPFSSLTSGDCISSLNRGTLSECLTSGLPNRPFTSNPCIENVKPICDSVTEVTCNPCKTENKCNRPCFENFRPISNQACNCVNEIVPSSCGNKQSVTCNRPVFNSICNQPQNCDIVENTPPVIPQLPINPFRQRLDTVSYSKPTSNSANDIVSPSIGCNCDSCLRSTFPSIQTPNLPTLSCNCDTCAFKPTFPQASALPISGPVSDSCLKPNFPSVQAPILANSGCSCDPCLRPSFSSVQAPILSATCCNCDICALRPALSSIAAPILPTSGCSCDSCLRCTLPSVQTPILPTLGCGCNSCALGSTYPCLQPPILPISNIQVPSCTAIDNGVINSLANSVQLLTLSNLLQNTIYLNSQCGGLSNLLNSGFSCGCGNYVCGDVVDVCPCAEATQCNSFVDNCAPCNTEVGCCGYPDYGCPGFCGFPDVVTSILNCRGRPLPDVLTTLLGYPSLTDLAGQCGCNLPINPYGECSTLPEVITPCDECSVLPEINRPFSNCNQFPGCPCNIPCFSPCLPNFPNPQCGCGFQNAFLPEVNTPNGFCSCMPDVQPFPQSPCCDVCGFQGFGNTIGIGNPVMSEVRPFGCFSGVSNAQCGVCGLPETSCGCNPGVSLIQNLPVSCSCLSELNPSCCCPGSQPLLNIPKFCNNFASPLSGCTECNNFPQFGNTLSYDCFNLPNTVTCNECANNYQFCGNPCAPNFVNQNVPFVPQIFGLQEANCISPNYYNIQECVTPLSQSCIAPEIVQIPQNCQPECVPTCVFSEIPVTSCTPEIVTSCSCIPEVCNNYYNCYECNPIEISLPISTGFSCELPYQTEILLPTSIPAELWIDPDSLPNVYLSIDPACLC